MAEKIEYDWDTRPPRGRPSKYPWSKWLNGETWRVVRHVDFDLKEESLRAAVSAAARSVGKRARVSRVSEGIYVIQASVPDTSAFSNPYLGDT
jgi:hypothetical protein